MDVSNGGHILKPSNLEKNPSKLNVSFSSPAKRCAGTKKEENQGDIYYLETVSACIWED